MKTTTLKFNSSNAVQAGILLYSLEMPILMTWTEEEFLNGNCIYVVCALGNGGIPEDIQREKIREKRFIKTVN